MQYILITIFALAPLYLIRFSIAEIPTTAFEVLVYGGFLGIAFSAYRKGELRKIFFFPYEKVFYAGLTLFLGGAALATIFNPSFQALGILKGWFFDPVLFFLLVRYVFGAGVRNSAGTASSNTQREARHNSVIRRQKFLRKTSLIFFAYAASGTIISIISLVWWFLGRLTYDGRLGVFFESPNHLAMYIAPALIVVLLQGWNYVRFLVKKKRELISKKEILNMAMLLFAACCLLFVLYATKSHGAWFGIVGALVAGWAYTYTPRRVRLLILTATVLMSMILPVLAVHYWPTLQKTFRVPQRSSFSSRVIIWRSALAIGKDHALFGIGPGSFQKQYLAYQKNYPPYLEWASPQPHNIFLAFWLQTGLVGLAGFLLLLFWYFSKIYSAGPGSIRLMLMVLMFYIILHGSVDTLYWKNDLSVFFWTLLALGALGAKNTYIKIKTI